MKKYLYGVLLMCLCTLANAQTINTTVNANHYNGMVGIVTGSTTDSGTGTSVNNLQAYEWVSYENDPIIIPSDGCYNITYRIATTSSNTKFELRGMYGVGTLDTVSVPNTGSWTTWQNVVRPTWIAKGNYRFTIYGLDGNLSINWFSVSGPAVASTVCPTRSSSSVSSSSVSNLTSSVTIEAENFTSMAGLQSETTSDTGGGLNLGYFDQNEWAYYGNPIITTTEAGVYQLKIRYASASAANVFQIYTGNKERLIATFTPLNTGGIQVWKDATLDVVLPAGNQTLYLYMLTRSGGATNFNWFSITNPTGKATLSLLNTASSASSSKASSSASSTASVSSSSSSKASTTSSSASSVYVDKNRPNRTMIEVGGKYYLCTSWGAPTERENGTPLSSEEIDHYEIIIRDWYTREIKFSTNIKHPQLFYEALVPFNFSQDSVTIGVMDKNGLYSVFRDVTTFKSNSLTCKPSVGTAIKLFIM